MSRCWRDVEMCAWVGSRPNEHEFGWRHRRSHRALQMLRVVSHGLRRAQVRGRERCADVRMTQRPVAPRANRARALSCLNPYARALRQSAGPSGNQQHRRRSGPVELRPARAHTGLRSPRRASRCPGRQFPRSAPRRGKRADDRSRPAAGYPRQRLLAELLQIHFMPSGRPERHH
jgi:hypothetical protein